MKHKSYKSIEELGRAWKMPESEIVRIEIFTSLVVAIQKRIKKLGLTHAEAAKKTGIGRTVITAVMNGNVLHMTIDRLITIANGIGLKVTLKVA